MTKGWQKFLSLCQDYSNINYIQVTLIEMKYPQILSNKTSQTFLREIIRFVSLSTTGWFLHFTFRGQSHVQVLYEMTTNFIGLESILKLKQEKNSF